MPNVTFSEKVRRRIRLYSQNYADYFLEMYDDTGRWSEEMIREQYIKEGEHRIVEITDAISSRLKTTTVLGNTGHNSVTIQWRHHNLYVTWEDFGDIRIVGDLEIR